MNKIAVVTDSNSGITQQGAQDLGVHVLPMPFTMEGQLYFEDVNLTHELFFQKLAEDCEITTSQPSLGDVKELWDKLLTEYAEIVHIPMSSELSASYSSAKLLAQEYNGRVEVVNNQRISVTQRQSVLDTLTLAQAGWQAAQIREYLERTKFDSSIYVMMDTLKYLKKGGRITPAAAAIGSILQIKPVLQVQGGKLDAFAKARGVKQSCGIMMDAIRADFAGRFAGSTNPDKMWLQMAYSNNREAALEFKKEVEAAFPGYPIHMDPLSLSVSCHIGPGALALACTKKLILNSAAE